MQSDIKKEELATGKGDRVEAMRRRAVQGRDLAGLPRLAAQQKEAKQARLAARLAAGPTLSPAGKRLPDRATASPYQQTGCADWPAGGCSVIARGKKRAPRPQRPILTSSVLLFSPSLSPVSAASLSPSPFFLLSFLVYICSLFQYNLHYSFLLDRAKRLSPSARVYISRTPDLRFDPAAI